MLGKIIKEDLTDWKKIALVLYLFMMFFSPPVIPRLNIIIPLSITSFILSIIFHQRELRWVLSKPIFKRFLLGFGALLLYVVLVLITKNPNGLVINSYRFLMLVPVVMSCIVYLICIAKCRNYDLETILRLALYAVLFQTLICLLAVFSGDIKKILIDIMRQNTNVIALSAKFHLERRFFGFANDLLDNFGYGMALATLIPIVLAILSKNKKWLIAILPIAFTALINARTSAVVMLIIAMVYGAFLLKNIGKISRKGWLLLMGCVFVLMIMIGGFFLAFPKTFGSFTKDTDSIITLLLTGKVKPGTTASGLLRYGLKLPDRYDEMLFGTGHSVFAHDSTVKHYQTDIGYLNDIWLIGVIGSLFAYAIITIPLRGLKSVNQKYARVGLVLILAFFVFEVKGPAIKPGLGMIMTLFISFVIIALSSRSETSDSKKVMQVMGALNAGGAEALVVDLYRRMHKDYQFVFLCYLKTDQKYHYEDEIKQLGGKIIRIKDNRVKRPLKFIKDIQKIIEAEQVDIVHSHVDLSSAYAMLAAKRAGVARRIVHSHNSRFSVPKIAQGVYKFFINKLATDKLAVSNDAGMAMFGSNYKVIINGIDFNKYQFNSHHRQQIRMALGLSQDAKVWLNVGRLSKQKNQVKLLNDFREQLTNEPNSYLIILGEGELLSELQGQARVLGIDSHVYFMGRVNDAYKYYSAADLFILTSHYEGLSIACLEAQANGLPCIMPPNTSPESIINPNVVLTDKIDKIGELKRLAINNQIMDYNIGNVACKIVDIYQQKGLKNA